MATLPPSDPWIERATRPLEDSPELCLNARQYLSNLTVDQAPETLNSLGERLASLDSAPAPRQRFRRWAPRTLIAVAVLLGLALGVPMIMDALALREFMTSISGFGPGPLRQKNDLAETLSAKERFYIWGDPDAPNPALAKEALWKSDPDNHALYADYLYAFEQQSSSLPPNFLDTAKRLDPGNAYFLLLAASATGKDAIERKRSRSAPPPRWTITKLAEFQEALALVREAAALSRYESYHEGLLSERIEILPPAHDFQSQTLLIAFAAMESGRGVFMHLEVAGIIGAAAAELAQNNSTDELRTLIRDWESIAAWVIEDQGNLVGQLVARAFLHGGSKDLLDACRTAGLDSEAERLERIAESLDRIKADQDAESPGADLVREQGSQYAALSSVSGNMGTLAYQPTEIELRPGRFMDYAFLERIFAWIAVLVALVLMLAALEFQFNRGLLARRLGARFAQLLHRTDWLWILGLGIALPLLWYLLITRLTPLGCRDWSITYAGYQPFAGQVTATGWLILAALPQAIRWRLAVRGKALRCGGRRPLLGWWGPLCFALAVPTIGMMRYESGDLALYATGTLLVLGQLWFVTLAIRALFGRQHRTAYRAAVARLLAPAYAVMMLSFLLVIIPTLTHQERKWAAMDDYMRIDSTTYGLGKGEHESAKNLRLRLREALAAGSE